MEQPSRRTVTEDARKNVVTVYAYLILGLVVSAITCAATYRVEFVVLFVRGHFIITMLLTSVMLTVLLAVFNKISYHEQKLGKISTWVVICFVSGVPLVESDSRVLLKAAACTVVLVAVLTPVAYVIPRNVVNAIITPLSVLHSVVLVCTIYSIVNLWTDAPIANAVCLYGGFLVYSTLLVCNTQRLSIYSKYSSFDPIFTAAIIFINIVNLVSRVATYCTVEIVAEKC